MNIVISIVIGVIIAFIIVSAQASGLKTVRKEREAANYVKKNSLRFTVNRDSFLYKKTEKTKKANNN